MKLAIAILGGLLCAALLAGCTASGAEETPEAVVPLTEADTRLMYSDPDEYKGAYVTLSGVVFTDPEYNEDGVRFQIWADPENRDLNTVVNYAASGFELDTDQYVRVSGIVEGELSGFNMFSGVVSAPEIEADSVEILSYQEVMAPTIATAYAAAPEVDQFGYTVSVQKVELAENETRVYVSVTNNGAAEFKIYDFNARIVQNGRQYDQENNYDADYPELQSGILPGVTSEGIITFPALEESPFQLIIEGNSDSWEEDIQDYVFDLSFE